uniref:Uncharacterized protein n=1 Tax=Physcomitrium patens TaxID=3218 RepID=A0A7I4C317_PHYPA
MSGAKPQHTMCNRPVARIRKAQNWQEQGTSRQGARNCASAEVGISERVFAWHCRINKEDRAAGYLENFTEGKAYKDSAHRRFFAKQSRMVTTRINEAFGGAK